MGGRTWNLEQIDKPRGHFIVYEQWSDDENSVVSLCVNGSLVRNKSICWIRCSSQRGMLQTNYSFLVLVSSILCKAINIIQCDRMRMEIINQEPENWNGIWHQVTSLCTSPEDSGFIKRWEKFFLKVDMKDYQNISVWSSKLTKRNGFSNQTLLP